LNKDDDDDDDDDDEIMLLILMDVPFFTFPSWWMSLYVTVSVNHW